MRTDIKVPEVGESITSGLLTSWTRQNGDTVKEGETICELETEKTTLEIPAPAGGILEIQVPEQSEVQIGQVIGAITAEVSSAAKPQPAPQETTPEPPVQTPQTTPPIQWPRRVSEPIVRVKAKSQAEAAASITPAKAAPAPVAKAATGDRPSERVPMSGIRKRTAERLVHAQHTAAYLTTFNEIDMQKVIDIRNLYKDQFQQEHGTRIGFMSFFVKACCQALKEYPGVNSRLEGDDIIYQYFYDIGVAISIDQGLLVPVIRGANSLCFAGIETTIVDMAERAKNKRIKPDELVGGTFTITNGGVFGSMMSTPIPAYPQTAILGMHAIKKRAVVVGDQIVIRPMMYVALSYDHRVIDGREAIGFLNAVKNYIEEPDKLLLEL